MSAKKLMTVPRHTFSQNFDQLNFFLKIKISIVTNFVANIITKNKIVHTCVPSHLKLKLRAELDDEGSTPYLHAFN